ncbi:MAG: ABC transporter ATP-binding protein [Anaerolineae bacterium]|nr:ABC transporter ATP-binding protein [Anaerolineae bacterium]
MTGTQAISVQALTRDYGAVRALKGISFDVAQGEVFGFLGPNGAGKTTTIKILTGQLRPSGGTAQVLGYDVVKERQELQARIGVVFEHQNLYERLSGRDNLTFSARLYGVDHQRVDQVLDLLGLAQQAGKKVKVYSNGMKQRLLIARALLHEPDVLFLDEPTRGLDPNVARDIRTFVAELADKGVTVFLTTHYMEEADRLSDRVAILHQGNIVALDTPAALKAKHGESLEDVFIALTGNSLRGQFEE